MPSMRLFVLYAVLASAAGCADRDLVLSKLHVPWKIAGGGTCGSHGIDDIEASATIGTKRHSRAVPCPPGAIGGVVDFADLVQGSYVIDVAGIARGESPEADEVVLAASMEADLTIGDEASTAALLLEPPAAAPDPSTLANATGAPEEPVQKGAGETSTRCRTRT